MLVDDSFKISWVFVQDLFNISPGKKVKREHNIGLPGNYVFNANFSSSAKDRLRLSRIGQYELVYDDNGEAVITGVQQDEGGAAVKSEFTDVASFFVVS